MSYSSHHIEVSVLLGNDPPHWRFTGIYRWAETMNKKNTFEMIVVDLKTHSNLPWVIGGDLNQILFNYEKGWDLQGSIAQWTRKRWRNA